MNDENMPHAPEAEMAILCLLIEYPKRFSAYAWESQLSVDFFHLQRCRSLWEIITTRLREGKFIDPASIRACIRDQKPTGLGISEISEILETECDSEAWHSYVDTLRDRYARRVAIKASQGVEEGNTDGQGAVDALRRAVEAATNALTNSSAVLSAKDSVHAFLDSLKERYENGALPGLPTGIPQMDAQTGGLRRGELWVIGGKTSRGKSVLMLQIASHVLSLNRKVAVFSLEMGADEVIGRLISCGYRIPIGSILNPRGIEKRQHHQISAAAQEIATLPLFVCDKGDLGVDAIAGHCQRLHDTHGLDLVIIDYLQLISASRVKGQNREQEVAGISRACKQLAKRLKCPVLTATQLNENGQARESRAIEQDADAVFYIIGDAENESIQVWKSRNGKRNEEMRTRLDGEFQRFTFL